MKDIEVISVALVIWQFVLISAVILIVIFLIKFYKKISKLIDLKTKYLTRLLEEKNK